jgi:DNA-directed RNA polymerase specialized sigma24 family protein
MTVSLLYTGSKLNDPSNHTGGDYRVELQRLAEQRVKALNEANQLADEIANLLPHALHSGVSAAEAAHLTGVSRPTLYRMLANGRQHQDIRATTTELEAVMDRISSETGHRPLPADIAAFCQCSMDEIFERLRQVYPKLAAEFADLGPTAMTTLVELMPELEPPEREILKMLLLHDMPLKRVAWSNQISEPNVLSWAALALLRLLPRMRTPV